VVCFLLIIESIVQLIDGDHCYQSLHINGCQVSQSIDRWWHGLSNCLWAPQVDFIHLSLYFVCWLHWSIDQHLCKGCNLSLLSIGYLLYQNNEIISYISYWRIISLLLHYVSLVDQLIIKSNIVLFMTVLIEISIKVVFSELVSKTVGLSSTLFPIQIVKQSINWLIFFFETPFYISRDLHLVLLRSTGYHQNSNLVYILLNSVINWSGVCLIPWRIPNSFSFVRDCCLLGGTHCSLFVHSHNMLRACNLHFFWTHYFGISLGFSPGFACLVWLLVSNYWHYCRVW